MWTALLVLLLLGNASAIAPSAFPVELNRCKPRVMSDKPEEDVAREAAEAANLSDHEALARLILTEAVASGFLSKRCQAGSPKELMEAFGWVVLNRVHRISPNSEDPVPDAYYNVIFARAQFRSSFSSSSRNPYSKIFLCPLEVKTYLQHAGTGVEGALVLHRQAREVAARVIEIYQKSGIPKEFAGITNFYLPYQEPIESNRPAWAKDSDPTKNKGYVDLIKVASKPCAEFYKIK